MQRMSSPSLGDKLKEGRAATGLTQVQAAEFLNVHPLSVSRWETGTVEPSVTRLVQLAELYAVPVAWFLEDENAGLGAA